MSEPDPKILSAALVWLLNHYEQVGGDTSPQFKGRVVHRIEDILQEHGADISIADMMAFRKASRTGTRKEGVE
jgi:hypothetical protein